MKETTATAVRGESFASSQFSRESDLMHLTLTHLLVLSGRPISEYQRQFLFAGLRMFELADIDRIVEDYGNKTTEDRPMET